MGLSRTRKIVHFQVTVPLALVPARYTASILGWKMTNQACVTKENDRLCLFQRKWMFVLINSLIN